MSHSSVSSELSNSIGRTGSGYSDRSGNGGKFEALSRAQALHRQGSRGTSPLAAGVTSIIKQNSSTLMVRGKPRLIRQVAIQDMENSAQGTAGKQVSFKDNPEPCPAHHQSEKSYAERFRSLYAKLTESSHEEEETEQEIQPTLTLVTASGENIKPTYDGDRPQIRRSMENLVFPQDGRRVSLGTGLLSKESLDKQIKHGSSLTNLKVINISQCNFFQFMIFRVWLNQSTALKSAQVRTPYLLSNQSTATASSLPSLAAGSAGCCIAGQWGLTLNDNRLTILLRSENVLADRTEEDSEERENLLTTPEENMQTNASHTPHDRVVAEERTKMIQEEPEERDKLL